MVGSSRRLQVDLVIGVPLARSSALFRRGRPSPRVPARRGAPARHAMKGQAAEVALGDGVRHRESSL